MYGHIDKMAQNIKEGIISAGGMATIYRVEETLNDDVLKLMGAPPKPEGIPIATMETLKEYDAFLFGVPTRYGNVPAQWSAFWDKTGELWINGSLDGKMAGVFVSTGTYGGGQEATVKNFLNYLTHHGIVFVPLGYKETFAELGSLTEIHGGSPWGAGTLSGSDGTRTASELELMLAHTQGKVFFKRVSQYYGTSKTQGTTSATTATANKQTTPKTTAATGAGAGTAGTRGAAPNRGVQGTSNRQETHNQSGSDCCVLM